MNTVLQSWMKATKTRDKNNKNIKNKKSVVFTEKIQTNKINIQHNAPLHIFWRKTEIGQLAKEMRTWA